MLIWQVTLMVESRLLRFYSLLLGEMFHGSLSYRSVLLCLLLRQNI